MNQDELCPYGVTFAEDEQYALSRYDVTDRDLYYEAWNETYDDFSLMRNDEQLMKESWEETLSDTAKLELKIVDKITHEYIGEVVLMGLDEKMPEVGIQILRKYQGQGIGTHIVKLFFRQIKSVLKVEFLKARIQSDNYISQRMAEKLGAVRIGEEGKELAELMKGYMMDMGRERFEEVIESDFECTQNYIICYKVPL